MGGRKAEQYNTQQQKGAHKKAEAVHILMNQKAESEIGTRVG